MSDASGPSFCAVAGCSQSGKLHHPTVAQRPDHGSIRLLSATIREIRGSSQGSESGVRGQGGEEAGQVRCSQIACYPHSCSDASGGGYFEFVALVLPAVGVRKAASGGPWACPCLCRIATGWRLSRTPAELSSSQRENFRPGVGRRSSNLVSAAADFFCAFNHPFGCGRRWLSCLLRSFAGRINAINSNRSRRKCQRGQTRMPFT